MHAECPRSVSPDQIGPRIGKSWKSTAPAMENNVCIAKNQTMSPINSKRKATPENQTIKVVIPCRPDLDRFKPANGKIFDSFQTDPSNHAEELDEHIKPKATSKKKHPESSSSKKIKSNHSSPIQAVERKPKKTSSSKPTKNSKPAVIKKHRSFKDESPDPDEDADIADIVLSDYEEPETKLREREPVERKRFAKLRKLRKQLKKKKSINKEVNSKRIVPDSDVEVEGDPSKSATKAEKSDNDDDDDDDDDDESEEESGSGSSGEEGSSETDEEERERKEEEFIVDDLATVAQKNRAQRRIDSLMPVMFRSGKLDNRTHFLVVCEYLIHHIILPQIKWRKRRDDYDHSCIHLDSYFHSHGVQTLESSGWTLKFRTQLMSRPYISERHNPQGGKGCAACRNRTKFSRKILLLTGKPYNPHTLNPVKPERSSDSGSGSGSENGSEDEEDDDDDDDGGDSEIEEDEGKQHKFKLDPDLMHITKKCTTLRSGEDCAKRAMDYHFFKHWKFHLLKQLKAIIKPLREQNPALKKNYRYSDPEPSSERLKLMKREIRALFQTIEADKPHSRLENLYFHFNNRLNKVKKTYANAG